MISADTLYVLSESFFVHNDILLSLNSNRTHQYNRYPVDTRCTLQRYTLSYLFYFGLCTIFCKTIRRWYQNIVYNYLCSRITATYPKNVSNESINKWAHTLSYLYTRIIICRRTVKLTIKYNPARLFVDNSWKFIICVKALETEDQAYFSVQLRLV